MTRGSCVLLAALAVAATVLATVPAAADHDTTALCLVGVNKEFQTIQEAVDDPLCLYVQVDAAVWEEAVVVRHSLTLAGTSFRQGVNRYITTLRPPPGLEEPFALVRVIGRKIRLKVKHIAFEGPLVGGRGLIGVSAEKDTRLFIRDCVFRDIRREPISRQPGFIGIKVGVPLDPEDPYPQITYAEIYDNRFVRTQGAGIVVEGRGTTASVHHNVVNAGGRRRAREAAPVGIVVRDGAAAEIVRNDVLNHRARRRGATGIQLEEAAPGVALLSNNVDRNDVGIGIEGVRDATVYRNALDGNRRGIVMGQTAPVADVTVSRNRVEAGRSGIELVAGSGNAILRNEILSHARGGVKLGVAAVDNLLRSNSTDGNGGFGLEDLTTGDGKSGTANAYLRNQCHGNNGQGAQSAPLDLCH